MQVTPLNSVVFDLRTSGIMHSNPCLEFLGFACLLASLTEFSESDLEVSPLAPPLVAVNVVNTLIDWHACCPGSRSFLHLVPHFGAMVMQGKYYSDLI